LRVDRSIDPDRRDPNRSNRSNRSIARRRRGVAFFSHGALNASIDRSNPIDAIRIDRIDRIDRFEHRIESTSLVDLARATRRVARSRIAIDARRTATLSDPTR